ncbi:MAG: TauD/TfdA family dioxygenase [Planctomycetaceae bacterium]
MLSNFPVDGQQSYDDSLFPYVINGANYPEAVGRFGEWVAEHHEELLDLMAKHGAVLLRGFPVDGIPDFDTCVTSLGLENFPYKKSLSNAVRVNKTDRVFTANEAPSTAQILFHHEMAQTPLFPEHIMFYCEKPADAGGATPICRSDVLYDRLKQECPEFLQKCEDAGLKYTNVMPSDNDAQSGLGRSWKSTLGVETKEEAEGRLRDLGYSWEWQEDGCLKATTPQLPAVMEISPGRSTFFNQIIAAYCGWKDERNDPSKAIRHGDETPLDAAAVLKCAEIAEAIAFDVPWQAGDIALIDNRIAMHARRPFEGSRKVLASLGTMRQQSFVSS